MITTFIEKIRNDIKGKDVKNAIADGIQTAYNDAVSSNSGAEVALARGAHETLGQRLDALDTAIADLQASIIIATSEPDTLEEGQICIVYN